ncbi:PqqD family protein [Jatrophihabitans telluris]|uniref:PqqD family protein n=1 Tax=Jatrophihabitans telluris TaxID=2038343 RepID=A0ABY4QY16_9ACTN|nr:PqqD family protein [Jatrophihabitans telluris]UQX87876.1 PqqD family protein [Jatrophihabitans telluris]
MSWTPADDGSVVILDLRSSRYLSLNDSAAALWQALVGGATEPELARSLQASFGVEAAVAEADVAEFLAALRARDLLQEES